MCAQTHLANPFAAAKTDTRLPSAAAHSSICFLWFVDADNIFRSPLQQRFMMARRHPPNSRTTVLCC